MFQTCLPTQRAAIPARVARRDRSRARTHSARCDYGLSARNSRSAQPRLGTSRVVVTRASRPGFKEEPEQVEQVTGVVFEPFSEVQLELATVDKTDDTFDSFARCNFNPECEAALNEQINVEYNISVVYHALHAYFDRDNVALPGIAEFFKEQSLEEREHAETCMKYQNTRGGRVKLQAISAPISEFYHKDKGDALYAMELALSLEKLNFQKLRDLWKVADKHKDPAMCDFVEGELLKDQVESIKQISEYVSNLRRVGLGHGVFHFDRAFHNGHNGHA